MASNLILYPRDYPETISGPTELELRVIALEQGLRLSELQLVQSRRENAQSTIDLRTEVGDILVSHARLSRSSIPADLFGRKGFFIGGETATSLTDKIYRLNFLTEEMSLSGASLGTVRHSGSAASSTQNAFIAGGNTTSNIIGQIDRLSFSRETLGQLSVGLIVPRSETAAWSTAKQSYFWGGITDGATFSSSIEALSQPANTIRSLGVSLGTARSNSTALSSNVNGYAVGGKTALGQNFASSIYKFDYSDEAIAPAGFALATAAGFATGTGNQAVGYIVGGRTAIGAGTVGTISRVDYGTDVILPISIALTTAKSDLSSCGSSEKGYIAGGGSSSVGEFRSGAETATIERLSFIGQGVIESVSILSIELGAGAVGSMAVSDYAPAIQSAKSKTIQGQFDPFYAPIVHRHDDRYRLIENTFDRVDLRQKLNADLDLFVDALNLTPGAVGLGSAANPFATITAAIEYAKKLDFNSHRLKIKVADGTYEESLVFDGVEWVGLKSQGNGASIILEGNNTDSELVVIKTTPSTAGDCVRVENGVDVWVRGVTLTSTFAPITSTGPNYSTGLGVRDSGTIVYSNITFADGLKYQVLGRSAGQAIIAGNVFVRGDAENHVRMFEGGTWSPRPYDLAYSIFPGNTTFQNYAIDFAAGLTITSLFHADTFGQIRLHYPRVLFTGAIVTGRKAYVEGDGGINTVKAGNLDSPLEWDYIPGSLPYLNNNNVLRRTGSSGTIQGVRSFASPISIPAGVLANDAVNLQQLLAAIKLNSNQSRIVLEDSIQILLGGFAIGGSTVPPFNFFAGSIYAPGAWGAGGPLSTDIYFSSVSGAVNFVGNPLVFTSQNQMCQTRTNRYSDKFSYDIDEVAGYGLGTTVVYVDWMAIGRIV